VTKFLAKLWEVSCTSDGAEPDCQDGGGYDGRLWHSPQDELSSDTNENTRAESGVKTVKRMLMNIVSGKGILDRALV
jgi:hypothetical protein